MFISECRSKFKIFHIVPIFYILVFEKLHHLCRYLHIKIINLGETPLTAIGVRLFHDFFNQNMHCFIDTVTTNGIQFDCSRTSTAITPLGFNGMHRYSSLS